MFLEPFSWRDDAPRLTMEQVLAEPELATYVVGWGRPGDAGVVAFTESGERVGAAWYRLFSKEDHGYGFVSSDVPELGIVVVSAYRGRGIGRDLMRALIHVAIDEGRPGLSLSVERGNRRAAALYESLGFRRVGRVEGAVTMLLSLTE
jgi:ribosomal protein S18 acetylase RimI-like enzyme